MEPIIPIARIEREAHAAAQQHACINAACPYPFGSAAGRLFKELYLAAQKNMTKQPLAQAVQAKVATENIA